MYYIAVNLIDRLMLMFNLAFLNSLPPAFPGTGTDLNWSGLGWIGLVSHFLYNLSSVLLWGKAPAFVVSPGRLGRYSARVK